MAQVHTLVADQANGSIYLPKMINFKPDEVFPVKDCVAVFDRALAVSTAQSMTKVYC